MKCITELKDWDFKIPELGFEKRVTLPYTWNVENERPVQLYTDRIGDDGRGHQSRHLGGGHQALVLIHPRHDGGGAAHGLVPDSDGILGLDVRQPVVVDDLQNLRLEERIVGSSVLA